MSCGNLFAARRHDPRPAGFHAAYNHGAHKYQGHGACVCVEEAGNTLIAGKQVGNVFSGHRVYREQLARNVDHLPKGAGHGHVDPVVILGREVDGRKFAPGKRRGGFLISAEQLAQAEGLALGLEHPVASHLAELADHAVNGADQCFFTFGQRSDTRFQCPGEESVEARVGFRVRLGGFAHVYPIVADKPMDHPVLERGGAVIVGQTTGQVGNRPLRGNVLAQNKKLVKH